MAECLYALVFWAFNEMPSVEPIQIILLSINLFVKDWFVGWLNGSLDARYSAIHSWHP